MTQALTISSPYERRSGPDIRWTNMLRYHRNVFNLLNAPRVSWM